MAHPLFLAQTFLFLWFISVVYCDHQKRDVHHKIVIQERRVRNSGYNKHRHHDHHDHHHHHHRDVGHHHEPSRHRQKDNRHQAHKQHSHENFSKENSYEEVYKPKSHGSHHKHSKPEYYYSQERSEEITKPYKREKQSETYKQEWIPLFNFDEPKPYSLEHRYERGNPKKDYNQNYPPLTNYNVEYTTVQGYDAPLYPPLGNLQTSNHINVVGKYENIPVFQESKTVAAKKPAPKFNNHKNSYEVTESNTEATKPFVLNKTESGLFNKNFKPFKVNVPETKKIESKPVLKRGRIIRGKRKH